MLKEMRKIFLLTEIKMSARSGLGSVISADVYDRRLVPVFAIADFEFRYVWQRLAAKFEQGDSDVR